MTTTSHTSIIEGCELRYHRLESAGKHVFVLVPGIGVSHRYFAPLAAELSRYGVIYMLDMPGFGLTRKPKAPLTIVQYADILDRFIEGLDIVRPVLIGHSMGCQITTELLVQQPELTDRLVMLAPTVNPDERSGLVQALRLLQDGFHEPLRLNYIVTSDYVRCGLRWYFTVLPYMLHDRIEDRLARVRARTLVMRGQHDVIVPRRWTEALTTMLPDARMREVPDIGHVCMYRYPRAVADACSEWFGL